MILVFLDHNDSGKQVNRLPSSRTQQDSRFLGLRVLQLVIDFDFVFHTHVYKQKGGNFMILSLLKRSWGGLPGCTSAFQRHYLYVTKCVVF